MELAFREGAGVPETTAHASDRAGPTRSSADRFEMESREGSCRYGASIDRTLLLPFRAAAETNTSAGAAGPGRTCVLPSRAPRRAALARAPGARWPADDERLSFLLRAVPRRRHAAGETS
ncbi:hypothetical protein HPB50_017684 [Hyalomma asiaticum]|uniref:Uncharacterized protein n=1 Tax=Hyalomma asiaticum TaxID=266040 RepID=A0ACB7SFS1_HYAAI|nr:hypothetical protein HPB50_017684 [Hyalomma asiaticum]